MTTFPKEFEDKYPKAATCLLKDRDALLTYVHFRRHELGEPSAAQWPV